MSIDASAKNMQAVCKAKERHDSTCPWGGKGNRVHLSWFDIERMGWEEGDVICGLVVVGDEQVATGMMRVDLRRRARAATARGGGSEEEVVEAVVRAASSSRSAPAGRPATALRRR